MSEDWEGTQQRERKTQAKQHIFVDEKEETKKNDFYSPSAELCFT